MNLKSKLKKVFSGTLSFTMLSTLLLNFPVKADDINEKYPYTMFAASEEEGAITINTSNICINGNIATNGTISSTADNFNVNGTKTENADEGMIYCFKKLDYAYFKGHDVETYSEDYIYEDMNINISNPIETEGKMELTGNINLSTGIKAFENIELNGEVENTNDSVIFSESGDIVINTTNLNLNGLVYAPEGCIDITAQNLNMNNVIIIADTIKIECPSLNANHNNLMAEFIGTDSELDLEIYAFGNYISEENAVEIFWDTTVPKGIFDVQISDDNCTYTSIGTVNDADSFNFIISEDFETKYIKVVETTYYGETNESIPFIIQKSDYGYTIDFLDSDGDGLNDIFELEIGTDLNNPDSDEDGLTDYQEVYLTGTDPLKYDSVIEGVRDADIDSDEDGLTNIYEIENDTDPLSRDTDNDGLTDYEEIFVYNTNPIVPDT
ncbi:MAG: thrombospondin type 3 repeat-containing protein, partial [Ruminococcus sp.]|nr:thrombospondin type 3 repeat-containing protein [Ruminococcus sp.]